MKREAGRRDTFGVELREMHRRAAVELTETSLRVDETGKEAPPQEYLGRQRLAKRDKGWHGVRNRRRGTGWAWVTGPQVMSGE